jgi:ribosomal protein RSM22 (predicted rRNA methylase)
VTIFELVKIALDELYAEATAEYGKTTDDEIKKRIAYLSASYGKLESADRKPVKYSDPATRFAYVFKYVAAHGDYLVQVLGDLRSHMGGPLFAEKTLRVSCVGGGPGSDIIALIKYLTAKSSKEPCEKVICYLLDREQAWADTWTELDESPNSKIHLNVNFQALDVTDMASWQAQKKFLQADMFTMSYFVSEVMSLDKNGIVSKFWSELFKSAKSGALFVYVDNGTDSFNDYFDNLCKSAGLEPLMSNSNAKMTPSYSEQASELAEYKAKFAHNPKIQAILSYRVLRKP